MTRREMLVGLGGILATGTCPAVLNNVPLCRVGKFMPYDAELQFLYFDGSQHCDTSFRPDSNCGFSINAQTITPRDSYPIGCRQTNSNRWGANFGAVNYYFYSWGSTYYRVFNSLLTTTMREFAVNYLNSKKVTMDGSDSGTTFPTAEFSVSQNALIGTENNSGIARTSRFVGNIGNVRITKGSDLVMDIIPVRLTLEGIKIGRMFDRISKEFLPQTGEFQEANFGPDK